MPSCANGSDQVPAKVIQHDHATFTSLPIENRGCKTDHGFERFFDLALFDIEVEGECT